MRSDGLEEEKGVGEIRFGPTHDENEKGDHYGHVIPSEAPRHDRGGDQALERQN